MPMPTRTTTPCSTIRMSRQRASIRCSTSRPSAGRQSGYRAAYADVAAAQVNPFDHYNQFGWHREHDPSVNFDTAAYLAAYPDVAAAGVNPLLHYLVSGIHEGARPSRTACSADPRRRAADDRQLPAHPARGAVIAASGTHTLRFSRRRAEK